MKKKILTALLLSLLVLSATWFYKLLFLWLALLLWRKELLSKIPYRHANRIMIALMVVTLFIAMPRYRTNSSDRVQLIYQDSEGHATTPPLYQYLANTIVPEEEAMSWGLRVAAILPREAMSSLSKSLINQYKDEYRSCGNRCFTRPIRSLRWSTSNPMSGVCSQFFNSFAAPHQAVYLIRPKQYQRDRSYPLVVFCHGGLGNWKLYTSILRQLDNCVVLAIPSHDLTGFFSPSDIAGIFDRQIPFLEERGYHIDRSQLHLMGLSNGFTASDIAYRNYGKRFKSITYISCQPSQTKRIGAKVILIGGGKDETAANQPALAKRMRANGMQTALYWDAADTHYTLLHNHKAIVALLNKELELS